MSVVFDLGANYGNFGLLLAKKMPDILIHLVEPDPILADYLRGEIERGDLRNVHLHQVAVSTVSTEVALNISDLGDKGTSSLLSFNQSVIGADKYWSQRSDLRHERVEIVPSLRLDDLFSRCNVSRVDFLKIDIQGVDLDVLETAGKYLEKIDAGMLEVPALSRLSLYEGENQCLEMAFSRLKEMGFEVVSIKPNDPACNELNVFFAKSYAAWISVVSRLGLEGIDAFDGKNYWHCSSSSPKYFDELHECLLLENQRLQLRIHELDSEVSRLEHVILNLDAEIKSVSKNPGIC